MSDRERSQDKKKKAQEETQEAEAVTETDADLEALDRALALFEDRHARPARIVMLRYFGGLSMEDIAALLDVSLRTVERDWTFARSWLRRQIDAESA